MRFSARAGSRDHHPLITVGTGIGTAVFVNGQLLPNTELGHLILEGMVAEHYCSGRGAQARGSSWNRWGKRFNKCLARLEFLFSPLISYPGGSLAPKTRAHRQDRDPAPGGGGQPQPGWHHRAPYSCPARG